MLIYDLFIVLNLIAITYIWLNTDAVYEWSKLLRLKFMKYAEYDENKKSAVPMIAQQTYAEFLGSRYSDSFFIRLITCPECGTVWFNIVTMLVFGVFLHKVLLLWLGFNIILTWMGYACLSKTMKVLLNA